MTMIMNILGRTVPGTNPTGSTNGTHSCDRLRVSPGQTLRNSSAASRFIPSFFFSFFFFPVRTTRGLENVFVCLKFISSCFGSAKTNPDQFKRAFEEGLFDDIFEAIFSYKSPIPEGRKAACKTLSLTSERGPVLKPLSTGPDQFFHS